MPASLDLKGQIFGFWQVIEKDLVKSKEQRQGYWICECSLCGNIVSVRGTALRSGKSTKCEECNRHKVVADESNNTYGKLTVKHFIQSKNNRKMWLCKCECGNLIEVSTTDLRTGAVKSCGKCPSQLSHGANAIKLLLDKANIFYKQEYIFEDFVFENGHHPRFDFFIPERNYIIEYDGEQHFYADTSPKSWNTLDKLKQTQQRDKIKNQYCWDHSIPIIRIPYYVSISDLTIFDLIPETSKFIVKREGE